MSRVADSDVENLNYDVGMVGQSMPVGSKLSFR